MGRIETEHNGKTANVDWLINPNGNVTTGIAVPEA